MRNNNYNRGSVNMVKNGKIKNYKGIVKVEKIG
jgi:hypothetical protein